MWNSVTILWLLIVPCDCFHPIIIFSCSCCTVLQLACVHHARHLLFWRCMRECDVTFILNSWCSPWELGYNNYIDPSLPHIMMWIITSCADQHGEELSIVTYACMQTYRLYTCMGSRHIHDGVNIKCTVRLNHAVCFGREKPLGNFREFKLLLRSLPELEDPKRGYA